MAKSIANHRTNRFLEREFWVNALKSLCLSNRKLKRPECSAIKSHLGAVIICAALKVNVIGGAIDRVDAKGAVTKGGPVKPNQSFSAVHVVFVLLHLPKNTALVIAPPYETSVPFPRSVKLAKPSGGVS